MAYFHPGEGWGNWPRGHRELRQETAEPRRWGGIRLDQGTRTAPVAALQKKPCIAVRQLSAWTHPSSGQATKDAIGNPPLSQFHLESHCRSIARASVAKASSTP